MASAPVIAFKPDSDEYVVMSRKVSDPAQAIEDAGLYYCPTCYPITRDICIFTNAERSRTPEGKELYIRWNFKFADLVASATTACQFCPFVACRLFNDPSFSFMITNQSTSTFIGCCGQASFEERDESVAKAVKKLEALLEKYPDADATLMGRPVSEEHGVGRMRLTFAFSNEAKAVAPLVGVKKELILEFHAIEDSPASEFIKLRPVNINPSSQKGIEKAVSWIRECLHEHPECPRPTTTKLPAKVLRILDDENLILVENNGESAGSYVALSYAWGGPQTFALRSDTLSQLTQGFKVSALPQTLQDAVLLARKFSCEYLWIDALCIIQDSALDRNTEIPKMPDYYQNSYVTISAGTANKASEGFLQVRDECKKHPGTGLAKDLLGMPYLDPKMKASKIYFREKAEYRLSGEPVCKRAWTLQERVLSPRVLIYGSKVVWQCNTCQKSDGGVEDWSFDLRASDHRRLQLQFKELSKLDVEEASENPPVKAITQPSNDLSELWYGYVREYSYLSLTNPEDKLSALSGLAIALNKLTGDEYLCGLWRSQLLRELMWSTYPDLKLFKPSIWRAPSWSWVSVNNQITFKRLPPPEAYPMAEIIECTTTPVSKLSPFGEISGAKLKIKAPILEFRDPEQVKILIDNLKIQNMVPPLRNEDMGLEMHRFMANIMLRTEQGDDGEEWVSPDEVTLLAMFALPDSDPDYKHKQQKVTDVDNGDESIDSTKIVDEKLEELTLNPKEEELIEGFDDDCGLLFCLMVKLKEDGTYERITTIEGLTFRGISALKRDAKEVELS